MIALGDVELVLASTSRYRHELLTRLTPRFRTLAPQVDEIALPGEAPAVLVERLADAKAREVGSRSSGALVIGSDQVADLDGSVLGKPGTPTKAHAQLERCSGREVIFHTAICLLDTRVTPAQSRAAIDTTRVRFRQLSSSEIDRYVMRERPLDCAGSFKCEGLGIALFEQIQTADPSALIGLPLIALCRLLREAGVTAV